MMKYRKNIIIYLFFLSFTAGFFCEKKNEIPIYLAKVDNEFLTMQKMVQDLDSVSLKSRKKVSEYINQWINRTILHKEAEKRGILNSDKYNSILEDAGKSISINFLLDDEIYSKKIEIPESEIYEFYNLHKSEYLLGNDIIGMSYIVFSGLANASEFKKEVSAGSWENVLERYRIKSDKAVVKYENDVVYKESEISPIDIWKTAIKLETGQISNPFKVLNGFMVLKLNFKQKAGEIGDMKFAKSDIKERLNIEKKRKRYLDFLRDLQIKYHPEIINDF